VPPAPTLTTPDDLATKLGVEPDDAVLMTALRAATKRFRGAVRWQVDQVTETLTVNAPGTRELRLPVAYITAVESIKLHGVELTIGTDVEWDEDGLLEMLHGRWPRAKRAVTITLTYGFAEVPDGIQEAVQDQAEAGFNIIRGLSSKQVGGITESFGAKEAIGVSEQWTTMVEQYRIRVGDRA
jgi:hypothetical protein